MPAALAGRSHRQLRMGLAHRDLLPCLGGPHLDQAQALHSRSLVNLLHLCQSARGSHRIRLDR